MQNSLWYQVLYKFLTLEESRIMTRFHVDHFEGIHQSGDVIQNGWQDYGKSRGTSKINPRHGLLHKRLKHTFGTCDLLSSNTIKAALPNATRNSLNSDPLSSKSLDLIRIPWCILIWSHDSAIEWKNYPRYWPFVTEIHMKHTLMNWDLTLNVRGPSYLDLTRSMSWLLMPWLLTSPGHQQLWYWLCRICSSRSYLGKDVKYLCHINME